jgi:hypothetical protein
MVDYLFMQQRKVWEEVHTRTSPASVLVDRWPSVSWMCEHLPGLPTGTPVWPAVLQSQTWNQTCALVCLPCSSTGRVCDKISETFRPACQVKTGPSRNQVVYKTSANLNEQLFDQLKRVEATRRFQFNAIDLSYQNWRRTTTNWEIPANVFQ